MLYNFAILIHSAVMHIEDESLALALNKNLTFIYKISNYFRRFILCN